MRSVACLRDRFASPVRDGEAPDVREGEAPAEPERLCPRLVAAAQQEHRPPGLAVHSEGDGTGTGDDGGLRFGRGSRSIRGLCADLFASGKLTSRTLRSG